MLMRRQIAGRRTAPCSASASSIPSSPACSGEPVSVVSTFVSFLRAIQRDAEQVHLAQDFLGSAQHGAAAPAFGYHQQERIELRREGEYVIRRQQRWHVEDHDTAWHLALQCGGELTHAR